MKWEFSIIQNEVMRFLTNYFRQCFCKHEWKKEEVSYTKWAYDEDKGGEYVRKRNTRVSITCINCGYHKSYWKF